MKPETRTVTELFERDVRYVVPLYQRPYVWDEEHQWEPLWVDMRVLLDHQVAGTWANDGWSHFLGAIVLDQETQPPGSIPLYTIIDGQQRLTTLQVFLAAAAKVAGDHGAPNEAQLLRKLAVNDPLRASEDYAFKVWPTNANRAAFRAVMREGGPAGGREDDPDNLIDEAYAYFARQIDEWIADEDGDGSLAGRVEKLRVTLCDLLKVVSITLEPGDNAQVIFETLNARGTPLLALDLVKNSVFHEASKQDFDIDRLYDDVWKPQLDDPYWREERRQGRLYRAQGELFLMHWLAMKLRKTIPATELFAMFRQEILQVNPPPDTEELIRELCRDAAILRSFDDQPEGTIERRFFDRLQQLDTTTLIPLALLLFRDPAVTVERRRHALEILESWLVRRSLLRLTTKAYNEQVAAMLAKVGADTSRADEIILEHVRSSAGDATRWPTDEDVVWFFENRDAYGTVAQSRLVMALREIEQSLYSPKVEAVSIPTSLTLEHVMPQGWERHWSLPSDLTAEDAAEAKIERQMRIHRLGNLTLTAFPLNSSLSNSAWAKKRDALNKHSKLLLNVELIDRYPEVFDESAIDERTTLLASRICAIWPGPDTAWTSGPDDLDNKDSPVDTITLDLASSTTDHGAEQRAQAEDRSITDGAQSDAPLESKGQVADRDFVRQQLAADFTPDEIYKTTGERRATYLVAIEEEARALGELGAFAPTPEEVAALRDERKFRWERIAARIFGDARRVSETKELYDEARGTGASRRSYTGRGRRFPEMEP
jgi:hypothetical protein